MVLSSDINKVIYVADGVATEFAINFKFFKNKNGSAQVRVEKAVGTEFDILKEGVDFEVVGDGVDINAKVVFAVAPEENAKIGVFRDRPFLQESDFINGQFLDMEELEHALDGIYMNLQELQEKLSRAVLTDSLSEESPEDFADRILGYKDAAQEAANESVKIYNEMSELVEQLGALADEINGEVI